jgi:flagellar hook-associated protein 3 FlgL
MRITNNMIIANMVRNISNNQQRENKYQTQLATGKKISVPSDDPVVAARALKLRTDVSKIEQYKKNISDAQSWLSATDEALSSIGKVLQTAREKMVQAANGTNTVEETKALAAEIKQLRTQVIHLSNSTYSGRYIFSGFKTDQKVMIDDETDPNFGQFAIDVDSAIRKEKIFYEVGVGDNININITGGDLFNSQDINGDNRNLAVAGETSSMIKMFDDVIKFMEEANYEQISESLKVMDAEIQNVLRVRADIGARQNRMDLTEDRIENDLVNFTESMSLNEDIDIAETIMNLKNEENVYQASLAAGARIIQQSLVDFLH